MTYDGVWLSAYTATEGGHNAMAMTARVQVNRYWVTHLTLFSAAEVVNNQLGEIRVFATLHFHNGQTLMVRKSEWEESFWKEQ